MTMTPHEQRREQVARIIRRIAYEAQAVLFAITVMATVFAVVWTLQGKL